MTVDVNMDKVSGTTLRHSTNITTVLHSQIMKLRTKFNKKLEKEGVKLSVNDFVLKATALASKKVPEANSAWMGTFIRM